MIVSVFVAIADIASDTAMRALNVPVGIVAPLMVPVLVFRLKPEGSAPAAIDHRYGDVPPEAASVVRYPAPATASGSEAVLIANACRIVIDKAFVAICGEPAASRTCTVKLKVPAAVGVPLRTPAEFNDSPVGKMPETADHVNGNRPLTALSDCEYSTPVRPPGRDVVEIVRGGLPEGVAILIKNA